MNLRRLENIIEDLRSAMQCLDNDPHPPLPNVAYGYIDKVLSKLEEELEYKKKHARTSDSERISQ